MRRSKHPVYSAPVPTDHLQVLWRELTVSYFQNRLPPIKIEWSSRLTASSGMFVSKVGPRDRCLRQAEYRTEQRLIRLSLPLLCNQPEAEIVRTLAHEMIHQWQFDVRKCRPTHGPDFLRLMAAMNQDGLGIAIRHSLDHQVEALTKYLWRCTTCGSAYTRQRRTISPKHHRCGNCLGPLREIQPTPLVDEEDRSVAAPSCQLLEETVLKQREQAVVPQQLAFEFE